MRKIKYNSPSQKRLAEIAYEITRARDNYDHNMSGDCKALVRAFKPGPMENRVDWENPFLFQLRSNAITLRTYNEYLCNGCTREKLPHESWKDYDIARQGQMDWTERRVKLVKNRIKKAANVLGLYVYFQNDPRGCSVYVDVKPIPDNNYQRSIAIY